MPGEAARQPPHIPDHELLRLIGAGSYGEVWLARSVMGTLRAVKIVHRASFDHERPYEREYTGIQKFEPISRSHEGFVDILQVGRNDAEGYFYYVMELADDANDECRMTNDELSTQTAGEHPDSSFVIRHSSFYIPKTLRSEIARRARLPFDDCVALGLSLARALAHLHAQGLVHRDIKPSNIIFVGGVPKLADIGLVTDVGEARSYVGTEGFIPPEGPGSPAADLFSLGKVLYEASTGKDRQDFPEPLTNLGDQPDKDRLLELNAILHRACHSDSRERYRSAEEMVLDLELLFAGKSVKQRHSTARRWNFAKKAAVVAAVGTLVAIGFVSIRRSRPQPLDPLTTGKNVGGYPPTRMRGTTNEAAWDHYRLGYSAASRWNKEGAEQAAEHYSAAIRLDPKFTLAFWGLWKMKFGDPSLLTHTKSDEFHRLSDKLVELDNGLAETHQVLAAIRFWEWKFPEAEAECREALRLNPDCLPAWTSLGFQLSHRGRTDEALQVFDRGLQIDPNAANVTKLKGHVFFVRRQFQQALDLYLEASRREPLFHQPHFFAARAYLALTNYPAAIDELERDDLLPGDVAPAGTKQKYAELRHAFQEDGARGFWLKQLDLTRARCRTDEYPYEFARLYARLGDKELALTFLEKAYEKHDELIYLIFDEFWDPWRDEPRFEAVRQKVGLPRHPHFPAK